MLVFQTSSATSGAAVAEQSTTTSHAAGGSTSDGRTLYSSTPEVFTEKRTHESPVFHAASSYGTTSAVTSVAAEVTLSCEGRRLPATCGWNSDPAPAAAASTSTAYLSSENDARELDNRSNCSENAAAAAIVAAADAGVDNYDVLMGIIENSDLPAAQREINAALTTVGNDVQIFQGRSTFRTVKENHPDSAEFNQCHSAANFEELGRKCSASTPSTEELSAECSSSCTTEISQVRQDRQPLQPQNIEQDNIKQDNNNNKQTDPAERSTDLQSVREIDCADLSALANCAVDHSHVTAASNAKSNDAFDVHQSRTVVSETITQTEQVYNSVDAAEMSVLVDDGSQITLNCDSSVSTILSAIGGADATVQHQQPNLSSADQQQLDIHMSTEDETVGESDQPFSSATEVFFPDEEIIVFDGEIPEIPIFPNGVPAGGWQTVIQQFVYDDRESKVAGELDSSPASPAGLSTVVEDVVCNEKEEAASVQASEACEATESNYQAVSASCDAAEEEKDIDVDVCGLAAGDQTVAAFRQEETSCRPLDLTCGRAQSTSDAEQRSADAVNSAVQLKSGVSYAGCLPMNMCPSSHGVPLNEYCAAAAGWSMIQSAGGYGVGWPAHPHPCCGHPAVYSGPPHPMFPGMPCPCHGAEPFRARRRSSGGRSRRQPAPSSCSRVDGIRSTKQSASDGRSQAKDINLCIPEGFPAVQELCPSASGDIGARPSSRTTDGNRSTPDSVLSATEGIPAGPKSRPSTSGEAGTRPSSTSSADTIITDRQMTPDHAKLPTSGCKDADISAPYDSSRPSSAVADAVVNVTAVPTATRGGRGGRRRGRAPKNSSSVDERLQFLAKQQQDAESQPPPVRRGRGRPRKRRDGDQRPARRSHHAAGGRSKSACNKVTSAAGRDDSVDGSIGRSSRRRRRRSPDMTVVARTETCETLDLELPAMSTSQTDDRGAVNPAHPSLDDGENNIAPADCGDLLRGAMLAANIGHSPTRSDPTAAAEDLTAECHHHHFPLMPPTAGSPAERMLRNTIVTSGAIIRKPRSRKQGRVSTSNTTTPSDESPASWQPLVAESAISSLLDTLSVAASDHEMSETSLTSCDIRLQTPTSTPFMMLERADLNRYAAVSKCVGIRPICCFDGTFHRSILITNSIRLYSLN